MLSLLLITSCLPGKSSSNSKPVAKNILKPTVASNSSQSLNSSTVAKVEGAKDQVDTRSNKKPSSNSKPVKITEEQFANFIANGDLNSFKEAIGTQPELMGLKYKWESDSKEIQNNNALHLLMLGKLSQFKFEMLKIIASNYNIQFKQFLSEKNSLDLTPFDMLISLLSFYRNNNIEEINTKRETLVKMFRFLESKADIFDDLVQNMDLGLIFEKIISTVSKDDDAQVVAYEKDVLVPSLKAIHTILGEEKSRALFSQLDSKTGKDLLFYSLVGSEDGVAEEIGIKTDLLNFLLETVQVKINKYEKVSFNVKNDKNGEKISLSVDNNDPRVIFNLVRISARSVQKLRKSEHIISRKIENMIRIQSAKK